MNIIEWLRVIFLGIVEGITEWLPVSSTGHLILVDVFWKTEASNVFTDEFNEMFNVVIQLGAILAVVTVFFYKLNPFSARKTKEQKHNTIELWKKVIIGCIPAGVIGVLFNDQIEKYLNNWLVVAIMLIVVGIAFIAIEMRNRKVRPSIVKFSQLSYKTAFIIGVFQLLALIPGTSRSGITIIGGMLFGCSRFIAAEYTFYLAIPVMFGASGLKIVKFLANGGGFTSEQFFVILLAMVVAYGVSMIVIKFLMQYIKRHNFNSFALYRIALGIIVLICGAMGRLG
jgi:undecaprenyl-diphosphatase